MKGTTIHFQREYEVELKKITASINFMNLLRL